MILSNATERRNRSRPNALAVKPDAIPAELRERPQWLVWRYEAREANWTKVPFTPDTERRASTTNAATWRSFAEAMNAYQAGRWNGIGYVFAADDPYCGIDLDSCRDSATGAIAEWATDLRELDGAYSEVSPSGTGLKAIVRAKLPGSGTRKQFGGGEIEVYDSGRYFALSGRRTGEQPFRHGADLAWRIAILPIRGRDADPHSPRAKERRQSV